MGICLYSAEKKVGGLAHILLGEAPVGKIVQRGKYARPAIESLLADLKKMALEPKDLSARIFGGASMFEAINSSFLQHIGQDNVKTTKDTLEKLKIPLLAEDTAGHVGRTITFFLDDGRILLRAGGKERYFYKA